MRVLTRSLFPLRLVVLSLLATLLLSGSAQAFGSEATGGGESSEVSGSKPVGGESSEAAKSGLGETETPPPNPVPIETPIPPVSTETTLPPVPIESPPPVPIETPPPVPIETTTLPVVDAPTEPTSPVVTETLEAPTRKLPPTPEGPSTHPVAGEAAANSSVVSAAESRPADMAPAVVPSPVPPASSEPIGSMLTRSTAGARPKTPVDPEAAFSSIPGELLATAQTSGGASCKVSSLQGPMTETCSEAWLGTQRLISATGRIDSTTSLRRSTAGGATGGGGGGFTGPSHPVSPPPGPAPSGASGASGAGGGSGPAPSAFLTLAGLLLLAAPRALRRLRLSCEPWLTAFFVLIPERPG
jgi:hypothetical protein